MRSDFYRKFNIAIISIKSCYGIWCKIRYDDKLFSTILCTMNRYGEASLNFYVAKLIKKSTARN